MKYEAITIIRIMPSSKDLLRSAYQIVKQHGANAEHYALAMIADFRDKKDPQNARVWSDILKWIKEVKNVIPPKDIELLGTHMQKTAPDLIFTRAKVLALIAKCQKEKNISVSALEREAGVPKDTLRDFIRGKTHLPRPDKLEKVLLALGYKMKIACLYVH